MREEKGTDFYLRWVLLLPSVMVAFFLVNLFKDAIWDELIFSAFGGERLQLFIMLSIVHPAVVVGTAHHVAPTQKSKVTWCFAHLWAMFMAVAMWTNLDDLAERWPIVLGQVIGLGVSFGIAASLEDESSRA